MSSLDFPLNPVDGQEYSLNGVTYYYNAALGAWLTKLSSAPLPTAFNRQVLFNDAGLSNGSYGLVFDKSANTLFANTINVSSNMRVSGNLYIGSNTVTITDTAVMARSLFVLNDAGHMTSVPSGSTSNLAFDTANAAYAAANNVGPQIAPAFNTANAAYNAANNVGPQIAPAFNTANVAYNTTNASFAKANTALQNTSGTFAGDLTATSSLRAPIFYDSVDTGYYIDPNSTSITNVVRSINIMTGTNYTDSTYIPISTAPNMYTYGAGSPTNYYNTALRIGNIPTNVSGAAVFMRLKRSGDFNYAGTRATMDVMITTYQSGGSYLYNAGIKEHFGNSSAARFAFMSNGDIYYHDNMQWRQYTHLEIYYTDTFTYYGTTSEDYQTVTRPWKSITTGGTTSWQQISWGS